MDEAPPRCAECGRRIVRRRGGEGWVHASTGVVAACDLDADHEAVPEPAERRRPAGRDPR